MPVFIDQTGRKVGIPFKPQRIISLVPSQTELLFSLGLDAEVVGITKFCVHPEEWFRNKIRIGGTKKVNLDVITGLQPDLIIANKEENVREQIDLLSRYFPVWVSYVNNLQAALEMIDQIGTVTGKEDIAFKIKNNIIYNFQMLDSITFKLKAAYLIWKDPLMTVGNDTFIHDLMLKAGLVNIFHQKTRYPEVTFDELRNAACDVVLLSSEPYPFKETHRIELQKQLPGTKIILVDGEMFSWYGSHLIKAPGYFLQLRASLI